MDKLIIEVNGKKIEVPLELTKIELRKDWVNGNATPELIIRAVATNKEQTQKWGEMFGLLC